MFDAVSSLFSSLSRRLRLRRWKKERTTSSAATDRVPLFSCGGGCDGTAPFVKRRRTAREAKTCRGRIIDGKKVHVDADDDEPCVWQRTILLGRRCQPLEFPGAIHYDSEGKMLLQAPRSPPSSPARSFDLGYVDRA
ncbi:hypothetical protein GUJ93_ZPchr0001g31316 [Zizania palustris]|uniref:Uncharacterized protein n=1 Tax=Zizania palustris TaxID=103762 RepID=A0A8J5RLJ1_ZIZPA|nr:hypothetical protein GUJ93_ZPchr0001g31316 [Zizania palustris]